MLELIIYRNINALYRLYFQTYYQHLEQDVIVIYRSCDQNDRLYKML